MGFFKKFCIISLLFFSLGVFGSEKIFAQNSSFNSQQAICYSQCAAYRFFWHGEFCFDVVNQYCSEKLTTLNAISFVKNVYQLAKGTATDFYIGISDLTKVVRAWLICKPLIEDCVVPRLNECADVCQSEPLYFAPDLNVGNPDSRFQGVYYDAQENNLYFKVANSGLAYAWDIDVKATYNHTKDRNAEFDPANERQLFKTKIEHLIYLGARNGPPKSLGDRIGDFLIDEALNGQYLQSFKKWLLSDFKSDSKNYSVPNLWIKDYPFTPKKEELNRITFTVDPDNKIQESNEDNNTFVLDIDLRPTPARLAIEDFSYELKEGVINEFEVNFKVVNYGEESTYAKILIYEGDEGEYKEPIYDLRPTINGKETFPIRAVVAVDPDENDIKTCGSFKKYTLVVEDGEGQKSYHRFNLPIYAGEIHGLFEDLYGKPVVGAKITAETGQETTTNEFGYFHLIGIRNPGKTIFISSSGYKVKITVSHPDFSKKEEKEVEFKMDYPLHDCQDGYLVHNINFVLKDVDVVFKAVAYDKATGQELDDVYLLATDLEGAKEDSRIEKTISGVTTLPEIQPGKYFFTLSKSGYKTVGQTVDAVPGDPKLGEDANLLRFYLEKLPGRENDDSLSIFESPQLLWEKDLGKEIFVTARATKDGKTFVFYTSKNQPNTGRLYFLETLTGKEKKTVPTISNAGNSRAGLDTSYDGNTTALCSNDGKSLGKERGKNLIKIFDANGNLSGEKEYESGLDTYLCEVSPDGYFLYPYYLLNKGFYEYTRFDTEGLLDYTKPSTEKVSFGSYLGTHFTRENNIFGPGGENCSVGIRKIFGDKQIACFDNVENPVFTDSSNDTKSIAFAGLKKVYWFSDNQKIWEKDVETHGDTFVVGVSPGGQYLIYNYDTPFCQRAVKLIKKEGFKEISFADQDERCKKGEEVVYVTANDKGIFYASLAHNKLRFYQVAKYQNEYQGEQKAEGQINTVISSLSRVENGQYFALPPTDFSSLEPGKLYYTRADIHLNFGKNIGSLRITPFTYFSIKDQNTIILIKGQLVVDFVSPLKVYALKFDRFNLSLFEEKLNKFINDELPKSEYFLIQNVHTKFTVKNQENKINVGVEKGEVEVKGENLAKKIIAGKQIIIDKNSKVKESVFLGSKIYKIIGSLILGVLAILLFVYRKTKIGKTILNILKKLAAWLLSLVKKMVIFSAKFLKIIGKGLINLAKSLGKRKGGERK